MAEDSPEYEELAECMSKLLKEHEDKVQAFVDGGRHDGAIMACANECQHIAGLFGWKRLRERMQSDARRILG